MKLMDVIEKMRRADKVSVFENGYTIFAGNVNRLIFNKDLTDREVDKLHPELLDGLHIYLKGGEGC